MSPSSQGLKKDYLRERGKKLTTGQKCILQKLTKIKLTNELSMWYLRLLQSLCGTLKSCVWYFNCIEKS